MHGYTNNLISLLVSIEYSLDGDIGKYKAYGKTYARKKPQRKCTKENILHDK